MIKIIIYIFSLIIFIGCSFEKKSTENNSNIKSSKWLTLKNKDSVKILGFSEKRINADQAPIDLVQYESERFDGDPDNEHFRNETLLIADALKRNGTKPDTLVLQVIGKTKGDIFANTHRNFYSVVIFNGNTWNLVSK